MGPSSGPLRPHPALRALPPLGSEPPPVMRQHNVADQRVFVDYAGETLDIINGATGEVGATQIFAGVLGVSNYTDAEPT